MPDGTGAFALGYRRGMRALLLVLLCACSKPSSPEPPVAAGGPATATAPAAVGSKHFRVSSFERRFVGGAAGEEGVKVLPTNETASSKEFDRVVREGLQQLDACFGETKKGAQLVINIVVTWSGIIRSATATDTQGAGVPESVTGCIGKKLSALSFPSSGSKKEGMEYDVLVTLQ